MNDRSAALDVIIDGLIKRINSRNDPIGDIDYLNERLNNECLSKSVGDTVIGKAIEIAPENNCITVFDFMITFGNVYYYKLKSTLNGKYIYYHSTHKAQEGIAVHFVSKPYYMSEYVSYLLPYQTKINNDNVRFYIDGKEIIVRKLFVNDPCGIVTLFFNEK